MLKKGTFASAGDGARAASRLAGAGAPMSRTPIGHGSAKTLVLRRLAQEGKEVDYRMQVRLYLVEPATSGT